MAEISETLINADTKLPEIFNDLTALQKDIYQHLIKNRWQTALNIAKAVKKKCAKDVNPDLYRMKNMNILEQNSKVWDIKAAAGREYGSTAGAGPTVKTIQLSELQEIIYMFLKSNQPSKAVNIAKGVGKTTAKDVNPDLYKMKASNLLSHNKQENLWTISADLDQHETLAHTLSRSLDSSSEDSAPNVCKDSDNKGIRRDSGIDVTSPCSNNTTRAGLNLTGPQTGESNLQDGSQMINSLQTITKIYNLSFQGCQNFRVGDNTWLTKGGTEPNGAVIHGDYEHCGNFAFGFGDTSVPTQMPVYNNCPPCGASDGTINHHSEIGDINIQSEYRDPTITAQEAEQQDSAIGHSEQSQDDLMNESSLLGTEEDEANFRAPRTSSPMVSSRCKQILNISGICQGLGNVTLDDRDNNGEECAVTSAAEAST